MSQNTKTGLSLSGGGYRAAAFHLGMLRKLYEMEILDKVDIISTISGGSITGAYYCLNKPNYMAFERQMFKILTTKNIIKYVVTSSRFITIAIIGILILAFILYLQFTSVAWISIIIITAIIVILLKYQFSILPVSNEIEKAYNQYFYHNARLSDLPDRPVLAISSTNLQTGRQFTFSKRKMSDSTYAYMADPVTFNQKDFPVARAVIASSSVPFAFTPVRIDKSFFTDPNDHTRIRPLLVDGGVYDNQGIHKLTQKGSSYECDTIIVSDAGNKLPFEKLYNNTFTLLVRTVDLFMVRIKHFQLISNIYQNAATINREVAYISLGWDIENAIPGFYDNLVKGNIPDKVINAHNLRPQWIGSPTEFKEEIINTLKSAIGYNEIISKSLSQEELKKIRNIGTNLTPLKGEEVDLLIKHAANLTELQVKLYCPSLIHNYVK